MAIGSGWLAVLAITSTLGIGAVAAPTLMGGGMNMDPGMMGDGSMGGSGGMMGGNGMHGMHGDHGDMCGDDGSTDHMMGDHDHMHEHEHLEECDQEGFQDHSEECEEGHQPQCCEDEG